MAYSDQTEFPRGLVYNTLGSTWTPFATGTTVKVSHIVVTHGDTGTVVPIIDTPSGVVILNPRVNSFETIVTGGFQSEDGLRFGNGNAGTHVAVFYFDD